MAALQRAMLFAAGLGTRMRPLTEHTPKALIRLRGRTLLDHALDRFEAAGVRRVVINTHHLAAQIDAHLAARQSSMEIVRSHEPLLLETLGGVLAAHSLLGDEPFYTANMDTLWIDGETSALDRLRAAYDATRMDALLLLQPRERTVGFAGPGDFALTPAGELSRSGERAFVYAGVQVLHPRVLAPFAPGPRSLRDVWFAGQRADGTLARMHGLVHDGDWLHVGTPGELAAAEAFLAARDANA